MRRLLCAIPLLALTGLPAAADCTCRSQGQDYQLGANVCLQSPKGPRIATCGMVLNNTSWNFTETPCVVSQAPAPTPARAAHEHGDRGGEATLASVRTATP